MTSTADSYNPGAGQPALHRLGLLVGHYSPHIDIVVWPFFTVQAAVTIWWHPPTPLVDTVMATIAAVILLSMWGQRVHRRNLCPRDLDAAPLLDPQGAVDKHARQLKLFHDPRTGLMLIATSIGFLAVLLVADQNDQPGTALKVGYTTFYLMTGAWIVFLDRTRLIHTRLRPWCPHCRRGPGDDHVTPTPTPDPAGVKTA